MTRVNESNHDNTNYRSLKAAQQAIMDALSSVAVNPLRLLNTTTSAITHTIRTKPNTSPLKQKERPMKLTARDKLKRIIRPQTAKATEINRI